MQIPAGNYSTICIPVETDINHFYEDQFIELKASHDHFSFEDVSNESHITDLLLDTTLDLSKWVMRRKLICRFQDKWYYHVLDAKRQGDTISVTVTPFSTKCYKVQNNDEDKDLQIDMTVTACIVQSRQLIWSNVLVYFRHSDDNLFIDLL